MENASKALIIAGAILLAIVIISLGLIVVNNVRSTADNTNLSEQEIQSFNAKFIAYEGSGVTGSRVNTLIQQVISTNQATADKGGSEFIFIKFPSVTLESATDEFKYVVLGYKIKDKDGTAFNNVWMNVAKLSSAWAGSIDKNNSTTTYSTKVNTGKSYKVSLEYEKGIVKYITVQ